MIPHEMTLGVQHYKYGKYGWAGHAQAAGEYGGTVAEWCAQYPVLAHLTPTQNASNPDRAFWQLAWRDDGSYPTPREAFEAICRTIEADIARGVDWTCESAA